MKCSRPLSVNGRLKRAIGFLFLVMGPMSIGPLAAVGHAESLNLDQCLARAKANNLVLKQADLSLRSADMARQAWTSAGLPQLRLSAGASFAPGTLHFGYDPALTNLGQFGIQFVLEQALFDGGRRGLKATQLDLDLSRMSGQQQLALRDLEFEVRQSFIEQLRAQHEALLRQQSVTQLSEYLDLVKRLHAGGIVAYTDLLKTQVELANGATGLSRAQQSLAEAKVRLAGLLGTPSDTSFSLSESIGDFETPPYDSASAAGTPDTNQSLDLFLARLDYERTASEITEVEKEKLPTIALIADAGLLTSRENLLMPESDRYRSLGYSAGITLDMPLFDWGGRKLRVQQKQLAAESAHLQAEIIRRTFETEYRSALARLAWSGSQVRVLHEAIQKAEDNFLLTKSKYAAGGATASEVLGAEQLLTETRIAELESSSDARLAQAKITRLLAY